jgi:hypothetical protein
MCWLLIFKAMDKIKTIHPRKPISKRIRFEIFKRDSFTCQYCGKAAPDVILEVDHVEPVSKGGKTVMLNLVTSCFKCNRGKSNVKLSDTTIVEKQKKSLIELNEKHEQLKMLLKWRSGLLNIENKELQASQNAWAQATSYHLNELGVSGIKKLLKLYGLRSVLDSMDIVVKYLEYKDDKVTKESVEVAFKKLKGVCYIRSLPEDKRKEYQALGSLKITMRYKYRNFDEQWASIYINRFIKAGHTIDQLKEIIEKSKSYYDWQDEIQSYI